MSYDVSHVFRQVGKGQSLLELLLASLPTGCEVVGYVRHVDQVPSKSSSQGDETLVEPIREENLRTSNITSARTRSTRRTRATATSAAIFQR